MRERWDEAINKLDEKYINEAAQAHAKHAEARKQAEQFAAESERPTVISAVPAKKSGWGRIIGVCSAAAAVVAVAIGGGVLLSRSDGILTGDPTKEVSTEATAEFTETVETPDTPDSGDYIIRFSQRYQEGYIEFAEAEKAPWLGQNGIVSPMEEMGVGGALDYAEEVSGKSMDALHNTLVKSGYTLDLGLGGSFYHGGATAEKVNRQVTLVYTKNGAEIMVNLGEDPHNFNYCMMEGGYRLSVLGDKLSTLENDNGFDVAFNICGMVQSGENYYAAEIEDYNWVNDQYNLIYCYVSAKGSSTEDIIGVVSSLICGGELTPVELAPLDLSDYEVICTSYDTKEYKIDGAILSELSDIVEGFGEDEPLNDIRHMDSLHERLVLYPREGLEDCYTVRLNYGGDEKTYYSIQHGRNQVYYEISEESGNALRDWFVKYTPYFMDGVITDTAGENKYILTDDKSGRAYTIACEQEFAKGDAVRVWYLNSGSDEGSLNAVDVTGRYNIKADDRTIVPAGETVSGYDADIYREHFLGDWTAIGLQRDVIMTHAYTDGFMSQISCGEFSDGYYMSYYSGGCPEFLFVPKDYPDTMIRFTGIDIPGADVNTAKRSEAEYIEYARTGSGVKWLDGKLGETGMLELKHRMGGNFGEVFDSALEATITDMNGTEWKYSSGKGVNNPYPFIKSYAPGTVAFYAEFYMEYIRVDSNQSQEFSTKWYTHTIAKDENGEWVLMASRPCNNKGEVSRRGSQAEAEGMNSVDNYAVLADYGICGGFSHSEYADSYILYPLVYVETGDHETELARTEIINPAIWNHGASPCAQFAYLRVWDISTKDGPAFAIIVPVSTASGTEYFPSLYGYDDENKQIVYIAGSEILAQNANDVITADYENGIISYLGMDGSMVSYRLDLVNFAIYETEAQPEQDVIPVDESKGEELSSVIFTDFFGDWSSDSDKVSFTLYSDMFGYDERCYSYKDDAGSYLMSEGRLWFIPASDSSTMYYFEDMQGESFRSGEADKVYTRDGSPQGFYGGNGEMGWLGVLDMLLSAGLSVDELFNLEITDVNGDSWVRTPDTSIDWGGVYSAYIYDGNHEYQCCFLKMQSRSNPEKFAYVSFRFYGGDGRYTDEHYVFDVSVMDTAMLSTDYAAQVKESSDNKGHGFFTVEPHFYPLENGSYYAVRMMGNNQAQWLSDGELFYNDGSGYRHVSNVDSCTFAVSGDYLFQLFNMYYEVNSGTVSALERSLNLWRYHDGYHLADIFVDEHGFVRMDADMQVIEGETDWLLIGFHDDEAEAQVQYYYDLSDPANLTAEDAKQMETAVHNDDGTTTVFFTDGTQVTLMIYV